MSKHRALFFTAAVAFSSAVFAAGEAKPKPTMADKTATKHVAVDAGSKAPAVAADAGTPAPPPAIKDGGTAAKPAAPKK
jgi:hypothetical protein